MKLYSGIDLHSTNSYLAIMDEGGKRIFKEKLPNDIATITERLSLYSGTLEGVVVESTYNWYWLVDGLMAEGYTVHLAKPNGEMYAWFTCHGAKIPPYLNLLTWKPDPAVFSNNIF